VQYSRLAADSFKGGAGENGDARPRGFAGGQGFSSRAKTAGMVHAASNVSPVGTITTGDVKSATSIELS
jgi:hypothetical protein